MSPLEKLARRMASKTDEVRANRPGGLVSTTTPAGIAAHDPDAVPAVSTIIEHVPLRAIRRHPKNRRPLEADVAARAAHMADHGQLEPIVVRRVDAPPLDELWYEIIAGETRWLAAQRLGWKTIQARIVRADDAQALVMLAAANAQRSDLNPIEQAELLAELVKPIAAGGAGLRLAAAAHEWSKSESWAANLVRLLELPAKWRERCLSGEIEQTKARLVLRYRGAPTVLEAFEKALADGAKPNADLSDDDSWLACDMRRDDFAARLGCIAAAVTRSIDPDLKVWWGNILGHQFGAASVGCLVDVSDPKISAQLGIVKIPVWDRRPPTFEHQFHDEPRATNTKLFDELQKAAMRLRELPSPEEEKKKGTAAGDGSSERPKKKQTPKKQTPAQLMAASEEKARRLQRAVDGWREHWLRRLVEKRIEVGDTPSCRLFVWGATCEEVDHFLTVALKKRGYVDEELGWPTFPPEKFGEIASEVARRIVSISEVPGVHLPEDVVEALAREYKLDVAQQWAALQGPAGVVVQAEDKSLREEFFEAFFELHDKEQLAALGEELGVYVKASKPRDQLVRAFMSQQHVLRLPKSIRPIEPAKKPRAKAKKRGAK